MRYLPTIITLAIMGMVCLIPFALAQSTVNGTANSTASVIADINVSSSQNLQFGNATRNDVAKTVLPTDTVHSAAFNVTGGANAGYTITLPASVNMITGAGGVNGTIVANAFTSNPASPGTLSAGGTQTVYVGGTRAAILAAQILGAYTASFTVTFTYQ